jgi:hypothetical protein
MWMALLTWRSPPRLSRWRMVLPEDAGCGAVPLQRANAASLLNLAGSQARSLPAEIGPNLTWEEFEEASALATHDLTAT